MAAERPDSETLLSDFVGLTGIDRRQARAYLEANQWDISSAAAEYFTSLEEAEDSSSLPPAHSDSKPASKPASGDSRQAKIDPAPQPIPVTSSMPPPRAVTSKAPSKKKFATLGDLSRGGSSSHSHDDESDDDDEDQDFFAGGEKSALAVQNPDELRKKILERARKNIARPGGDDPVAPTSHFTGTAQTLGGDDTPSQIIEDPSRSTQRDPPPVQRVLHFWQDGFSVDDGPLYRADDPANADNLARIRAGEAPLPVMNVQRNQQVDVQIVQHSEKYVASKKYQPFAGDGYRLGNPTPGSGLISEVAERPTTTSTGPNASQESSNPAMQINASEPTISIQIRLGDGTRLVSRFNTFHTIGDVYSFVAASSTSSQGRNWVLMTTFPSKELHDKTQKLGDLAEFRRGGVVVQKWQ